MRCDPLSSRKQTVRQHDLSLPVVPQVGSVPRRRMGDFSQGCIALHARAAVGIPLICAGPPNILPVVWNAVDLRAHGTRPGD
jgi:hypothetical protein